MQRLVCTQDVVEREKEEEEEEEEKEEEEQDSFVVVKNDNHFGVEGVLRASGRGQSRERQRERFLKEFLKRDSKWEIMMMRGESIFYFR